MSFVIAGLRPLVGERSVINDLSLRHRIHLMRREKVECIKNICVSQVNLTLRDVHANVRHVRRKTDTRQLNDRTLRCRKIVSCLIYPPPSSSTVCEFSWFVSSQSAQNLHE
jgi:hypothetical protein